MKHGEPGSEKFWELFPENHDLNGPGPYSIDEGYLMDKAVALDYPHLRKVQDICHELANGVDQGRLGQRAEWEHTVDHRSGGSMLFFFLKHPVRS